MAAFTSSLNLSVRGLFQGRARGTGFRRWLSRQPENTGNRCLSSPGFQQQNASEPWARWRTPCRRLPVLAARSRSVPGREQHHCPASRGWRRTGHAPLATARSLCQPRRAGSLLGNPCWRALVHTFDLKPPGLGGNGGIAAGEPQLPFPPAK